MEPDKIQMIEWVDIKGYEGLYQISICGKIKSLPKKFGTGKKWTRGEMILKTYSDRAGYVYVSLSDSNKIAKKIKVHRLIAITFIPNPNNLAQVNHIDGVKWNNEKSNLEWCTPGDNQRHAFKLGLKKGLKGAQNHAFIAPVNQYDLDGNFIRQWPTLRDIMKETGFDKSAISRHCKGNKNYSHAYGFKWAFAL
jgi:hypothetical protein